MALLLRAPEHSLQLFPRFFFFFNDTATTEIYTLSLHDALPISSTNATHRPAASRSRAAATADSSSEPRSEEHTSELQSRQYLVCRLLLEKKKKMNIRYKDGVRRVRWVRRSGLRIARCRVS